MFGRVVKMSALLALGDKGGIVMLGIGCGMVSARVVLIETWFG